MDNATIAYLFLSFAVFVLGSCIGSFLNVCICRIPQGKSVVLPRSHCPVCGATIGWRDNIPFLSYALLLGKCRNCGCRISPRYPLVEFVTALLFLLVWLKAGFPGQAPALGLVPAPGYWLVAVYWLGVSGLVLATFVDFEHMIIPDRVSLGGIAAGLILSSLLPEMQGAERRVIGLRSSAAGAVIGAGILWSIAGIGALIFGREAMGMGDVKLMGAIGAFLGWRSVLFTLVVSSFIGAGVGLSLVAAGKSEMKGKIPYGPYLALAAVLWLLWGPHLWDWYGNFIAGMVAPPYAPANELMPWTNGT